MHRTVLAATLALAVVGSGGSASARSDQTSCSPRPVLTEPTHTRGRSNTIRWEAIPGGCWTGGSTERRFVVTITNTATGAKETVTVHGASEVDATIDPGEFPGGPAVDGLRFSYRVQGKERYCSSEAFGVCTDHSTRTFAFANDVVSTQDDRAPLGSLTLAGGQTYVRTLEVPATVAAADPGGAASGPGYVAFGGSARPGGCRAITGCAEPLAPGLTVRLEPGPDGLRTIEARIYDKARGPADDPGATTIGTPPGNASAPFTDTVLLDRTAPYIFMRISTVRVTVGAPVTIDASQTVDTDGSGVQPTSGEWTFGDGGRAFGLVATHTYARTGTFQLAFSVADQAGNVASSAPADIEVVAAPVPPQPRSTETPPQAPTPTTVDRRAPTLSALSVRRRNGRATLAFRVSERAVVRVEVRRVVPRPARRTAALSRSLAAGRRGIVLPTAATRKRGRYVIVLVARDRAGNVSKPRTLVLTTR